MAEHALVNALNEDALRTLIDALLAAFGPVANLPRGNAAVARLGQNLWQLVPPRADRRLRELCGAPISFDSAVSGTRQAMRRAGLFAAGGLAIALPLVAFELGLPPSRKTRPTGSATSARLTPDRRPRPPGDPRRVRRSPLAAHPADGSPPRGARTSQPRRGVTRASSRLLA